MPKVMPLMLSANQAEILVAEWLSARCLVRPVAAGTDVGVDLYCESTQQDEPFLHFLVQVKLGSRTTRSFDLPHLLYWDRLSLPFFIFLVPKRGPSGERPRKIHMLSYAEYMVHRAQDISQACARGQKSLSVKMHRMLELTLEDLQRFLLNDLRLAHVLISARRGIVEPLPDVGPQYQRVVPIGFRHRYADKTIDLIRNSSAYTLMDLIASSPDQRDRINTLGDVVEQFTAKQRTDHWEDFCAAGGFNRWRAETLPCPSAYENARINYQKARDCIIQDTKIDATKPPWSVHLQQVDDSIALCLKKLAQHKENHAGPPVSGCSMP